jgi:signal transduction histidine kinase
MPNVTKKALMVPCGNSTAKPQSIADTLTALGYTVIESAVPTHADLILFHGIDAQSILSTLQEWKRVLAREMPSVFACFAPENKEGLQDLPAEVILVEDHDSISALAFRIAQAVQVAKLVATRSQELAKLDIALKQREEFLGVCAHDLRSPLALIQTCLSMVLREEASVKHLDSVYRELLTRAHRQSGHALTLVRDLLDVMALEQGLKPHYQIISLHGLMQEFYEDYQIQAKEKKIQFHYHNPVPTWNVLADSDRIRQLLQNLFTNALKFTESGKNIFLNVVPFQGRRKKDPPHPMVVISLKDEGKGIPQNELQKIFDRFVQIKENGREGGRGLGLSVAKQISTLHDGNIWVESEPGKGSTFFVLFPHTLSAFMPSQKTRVLVAEPSETRRQELGKKLKRWGYEVDFAEDGIEAVTLLYHHGSSALLLSQNLSKISTSEVTCLLRSDPALNSIPLVLTLPTQVETTVPSTCLVDSVLKADFTEAEMKKALQGKGPSRLKAA